QGSVPQAIVAFLESRDYEDAVRLAISIGGDSDTIACITGGIAAAYYKSIPDKIVESARERLPSDFLEIIDRFDRTYSRP
ncbi:MAG: ADP-ribosylglycohydrolase family protein, partial [Bacteroidota bacterium]